MYNLFFFCKGTKLEKERDSFDCKQCLILKERDKMEKCT